MYHQPAHLSRATLTSRRPTLSPCWGGSTGSICGGAVAGHEVAVVVAVVVVGARPRSISSMSIPRHIVA
ncbi:hypothetical protein Syun_003289 [Stephania yunnanensis]|uniref:Uncharacterized protein n=1 Tax=Stephania yunnanensis TaxID=152371 RepID=A0AAP0L0V2_9MAGN